MTAFGRFLDADGNTILTSKTFADLIAAADFSPKKLFFQNDLTRDSGAASLAMAQYGSELGNDLFRWAIDTATLSCPFNVTATLQSGGSLAASTTYYFRVTAFNQYGETCGSIEVSATTTSVNKTILVAWDAVPGAWGYIVYRSTNQVYTSARRSVIESSAITSYADSGQTADPSSPYGWPGINTDFDLPSENTTAGEAPDYGNAPSAGSFGTADLSLGVLKPGQQAAFWIDVIKSISTPGGLKYLQINATEAT